MSIFVLLLHPKVPCQVHSLQSSEEELDQANAVVGLCRWDVFIAFSPVFPFCPGPESRADLSIRQTS